MADEIGWSREKVKDYKKLKDIYPCVWQMIGAEFKKTAPMIQKNDAPKIGAIAPITEGLLR